MIYFLVLKNSWREFGTEKVSEPVSERIWYRKSPKTGLRENLVPKKSWNRSRREFGTEKVLELVLEKTWYRKKSQNRSWRKCGTKKVLEPVSERMWYKKCPGTGLGENFVPKKSRNRSRSDFWVSSQTALCDYPLVNKRFRPDFHHSTHFLGVQLFQT